MWPRASARTFCVKYMPSRRMKVSFGISSRGQFGGRAEARGHMNHECSALSFQRVLKTGEGTYVQALVRRKSATPVIPPRMPKTRDKAR